MGILLLIFLSISVYLNKTKIKLYKRSSLLAVLIVVYVFSGAVSGIVGTGNDSILIDTARYSAVSLLLLLGGADFILKRFREFSIIIVLTFFLLSILGLLSVLFGTYSIGVVSVTQYYPIRAAGYEIPTSSSILWNTNYYAICLLISASIFIFSPQKLVSNKPLELLVIITLFLSLILTRSRSAWVTSVLVLGPIVILVYRDQLYERIATTIHYDNTKFIVYSLIISSFFIAYLTYTYAMHLILYDLLWSRGLNNRYGLYRSAIQAFQHSPSGYGFGGVSDAMTDFDARTTTTQNSFLAILLMGSIPGLLGYMLIIFVGIQQSIRRLNKAQDHSIKILIPTLVIIFIVSLDGMWRTYMFGGTGFIPFMFTLAIISPFINWDDSRDD